MFISDELIPYLGLSFLDKSLQWTLRTAITMGIWKEDLHGSLISCYGRIKKNLVQSVISEQIEEMCSIYGKGPVLIFVPRISLTTLLSVTFPVICLLLTLFHFPLSHPWDDINRMHSINLNEVKAFKALSLTVFYFTLGCKLALIPGLQAL